ncbi:hypothetical protein BGW36DRAFT_369576 [Talaromyces proteolyticus]|uniref:DUF1746 domain-containing protein n=1 Tax=Talaromyces proteolyticus TaxID=1131652 RepID=A0AAD4L2V7_9EURO|nr:uncharacterized protein BGW36DRAFT_369576 [Talaromyces proteolyticus]KAH8703584.1 hypothetical protein BGW36DRAFT_369576 [Talaromyces proteolyticus]
MTTPDAFRDAEYFADVSGIPDPGDVAIHGHDHDGREPEPAAPSAQQVLRQSVRKKAKIAFIDRLLRELDIVLYCELAALYYMDCSLLLFALRAIVQLILFTPKAPPFDPTRNQPFVGAIFSSNLLCMLLHLLFIHPGAGEETRGYLYGGLFIDFVGQKAPVSRLRFLVFDALILLIHLVMMGLIMERVRTNGNAQTPNDGTAGTADDTTPVQDHDAEERGVHRHEENDTLPDPIESTLNDTPEHTELLAEPDEDYAGQGAKDIHPLDTFASGEAVILDMGLLDTIRDQWAYNPATLSRSTFTPSPEATSFLREHLGIEVGPDGRVLRIQR